MSEFTVEGRTKALESVVAILKRAGRRENPGFREMDAWRRLRDTRQSELPLVAGSDFDSTWRLDMDICDRRIAALESFRRDGVTT